MSGEEDDKEAGPQFGWKAIAESLNAGLQHLIRPRQLLSTHNLICYALPSAYLLLWLSLDIGLTTGLWRLLEVRSVPGWSAMMAVLLGLVLVGWLTYVTKYFTWFWGYGEGKRAFRRRIAEHAKPEATYDPKEAEEAGRKVIDKLWGTVQDEDRATLLREHVVWIAIVHCANHTWLSLCVLTVLWAVGYWADHEMARDIYVALAALVHVVLGIYFYRGAVDRRGTYNQVFEGVASKYRSELAE